MTQSKQDTPLVPSYELPGVVARETATIPGIAGSASEGKQVPITGVSKLLFENGEELFGCDTCPYTNTNPISVRSHLRTHGAKTTARRLSRENAELKAKKAVQFANRSNGVKTGRAATAQRREALKDKNPAELLTHIATALGDLATEIRDVAVVFGRPAPLISDEELRELRNKAAALDSIKAAFK